MSAKMSKILSVERVLQKLLPAFEWQLQASEMVPNCDFMVAIGPQSFEFRVSQGHVDIIPGGVRDRPNVFTLTSQELTMLLFGIAPVAEIIGDNDIYRGDKTRGHLLEILFPPRKPYILPFNDY